MLGFVNTILTNQFFLMFLAIATGLLIGKIKIKSFHLEFPAAFSLVSLSDILLRSGPIQLRKERLVMQMPKGFFPPVLWHKRFSHFFFCCS